MEEEEGRMGSALVPWCSAVQTPTNLGLSAPATYDPEDPSILSSAVSDWPAGSSSSPSSCLDNENHVLLPSGLIFSAPSICMKSKRHPRTAFVSGGRKLRAGSYDIVAPTRL